MTEKRAMWCPRCGLSLNIIEAYVDVDTLESGQLCLEGVFFSDECTTCNITWEWDATDGLITAQLPADFTRISFAPMLCAKDVTSEIGLAGLASPLEGAKFMIDMATSIPGVVEDDFLVCPDCFTVFHAQSSMACPVCSVIVANIDENKWLTFIYDANAGVDEYVIGAKAYEG